MRVCLPWPEVGGRNTNSLPTASTTSPTCRSQDKALVEATRLREELREHDVGEVVLAFGRDRNVSGVDLLDLRVSPRSSFGIRHDFSFLAQRTSCERGG